jgi:hypothetical protein
MINSWAERKVGPTGVGSAVVGLIVATAKSLAILDSV